MTEVRVSHWRERYLPNNIFTTIRLEKASNVFHLSSINSGFVFRGQSNSSWPMKSSLERAVVTHGCSPGEEKRMLAEFQRRAHFYIDSPPGFSDTLDWLALMQHYGCPTRLVDFSESIFIALYFACEDCTSNTDAAVWAINRMALYHRIMDDPLLHVLSITDGNRHDALSQYLQKNDNTDAVVLACPHRMNERMMRQQGTFLIPLNSQGTFERNLFRTFIEDPTLIPNTGESMFDENDMISAIQKVLTACVVKWIIPANIKAQIKMLLQQVNIDAHFLFPGLEGLAKSQVRILETTKANFTYKS